MNTPEPNAKLDKALAYIEDCKASRYKYKYMATATSARWPWWRSREYIRQKTMVARASKLAFLGYNVFMYERIDGRWELLKKQSD